jgi:apolipoprotein N-acyltransferase
MRSIPLRLWFLVALSALLQLLPFPLAGPVPTWRRLFCWFCLVPLLSALLFGKDRNGQPLKPLQTAYLGYLCGFLWYMGNCYWIYQTMHLYGGIPKPASFGILIAFSLYVGLYHALFGWLLGLIRRLNSLQIALAVSPFLWVAVELARARITGFPWDLLGYTQVDFPGLSQLAPWTGVMGISFVVAGVNAWLLAVPVARNKKRACIGLGVTALLLLTVVDRLGNLVIHRQLSGRAVLLQENLSVGAEGVTSRENKQQMLSSFDALSRHPQAGRAMDEDDPPLIIWPEAPADFVDSDPIFRQSMSALATNMRSPVIVDSVSFASLNPNGRYNLYNSASFFHADGRYAGHYDKMHLVPFGEYTPYKPLFFFVGHLLDDLPFIPGEHRTTLDANGERYGVFICYESIFGDEIRRFVGDGANVLVNISDDGWYGDTSAPWEHLDMVKMRAIENHRWVLRSTNTGVTAVIDPEGHIEGQLPRHVRSSLGVYFAFEHDLTFYTRHGDWFAWLCAFVSAGALAYGAAQTRFSKPAKVH